MELSWLIKEYQLKFPILFKTQFVRGHLGENKLVRPLNLNRHNEVLMKYYTRSLVILRDNLNWNQQRFNVQTNNRFYCYLLNFTTYSNFKQLLWDICFCTETSILRIWQHSCYTYLSVLTQNTLTIVHIKWYIFIYRGTKNSKHKQITVKHVSHIYINEQVQLGVNTGHSYSIGDYYCIWYYYCWVSA